MCFIFTQCWGISVQRCQALESVNEDLTGLHSAQERLTLAEWILRLGTSALLRLSHIGSCFSRAILHFGFWRWVRAASVWAPCEWSEHSIIFLHTLLLCVVLCLTVTQHRAVTVSFLGWGPLLSVRGLLFRSCTPPFWSAVHSGHGVEWAFGKEECVDLRVLDADPNCCVSGISGINFAFIKRFSYHLIKISLDIEASVFAFNKVSK